MLHLKRTFQATAIALVLTAGPILFHQTTHFRAARNTTHRVVFQQSSRGGWTTQAVNYEAKIDASGLSIPVGRSQFRMNIQGAKRSSGIGRQPEGHAREFAEVAFRNALPGIDVVYHSSRSQSVEFDFVVAPGADPNVIGMDLGASDALKLNRDGALSVYSAGAEVRLQRPVAWQEVQGRRAYVDARYRVDGRSAGFELGAYDRTLALLIDPTVLVLLPLDSLKQPAMSAKLPAAAEIAAGRSANALAIGADGSLYLGGRNRAWVAKMDAQGQTEVFRTNLGEEQRDVVNALTVDAQNNAYAAGSRWTGNVETGFTSLVDANGVRISSAPLSAPATAIALGPKGEVYYADGAEVALQGGWKLTAPGPVKALAVDSNGVLYAAGSRVAAVNGGQTGNHAWVASIVVNDGSASLTWSLPLAGSGSLDEVRALAVASDGSIYAGGVTNSFDFPVRNAAQSSLAGFQDGFLAKIHADGSGTDWATFFGGRGTTAIAALSLDSAGNLMAVGSSDAPDLLMSQGGSGRQDGFFARLDASGNVLDSIYSGASGVAQLTAIASAPTGEAYMAGAVALGTEEVLAAKVTLDGGATVTPLGQSTSRTATPKASGQPVLVFTTQPSNATAGVALAAGIVVQVQINGVVSPSNAAITLTSTPAELSTTVTAVNGVATFPVVAFATAGPHTITATAAGIGSTTSSSFTIAPGAITRVRFRAAIAGGYQGIPISPAPAVETEDDFGNFNSHSSAAITITSTPAGFSSTVIASNGVATFNNMVFNTLGTYTAMATSSGLKSSAIGSFTIGVPPPVQLAFGVQPGNGIAGAPLSPAVTVQIQDAAGHLVPTATNAVTIGAVPGQFSATINAVNGIATFSKVALLDAGIHTLSATAAGLTAAGSASFTISPAAAYQFAFAGTRPDGQAGVALPAAHVQIQDQYSNVVTSSSAAVTLSWENRTTAAGGAVGTANAVNGVAVFALPVFYTTGNYQLVAHMSDFVSGLQAADSNIFVITAGAAKGLTFSTQPANGPATVALAPVTVQVLDTWGNAIQDSSISVTVTSSPAGVTEKMALSNHAATFTDLTFNTPGTYELMATTTAIPSYTALSSSFVIATAPGVPSKLSFVGTPPASGYAGVALPLVSLTVQDSLGNPVSGVAVNLASSPTGLPAASAITGPKKGDAQFLNLVFPAPGSFTVTASIGGLTASWKITLVWPLGTPSQMSFVTQPAGNYPGGILAPFSVKVTDSANNPVNGAVVSITSSPAAVTASSSTTAGGVAQFSGVSFPSGGTYTLTAKTSNSVSATSLPVVIDPLPPSQLAFAAQPSVAVAGTAISPAVVVQVLDANGNIVQYASTTVNLFSQATNVFLGTANAVNGVATFSNVVLEGAGPTSLIARSPGLTGANSSSFTVFPAQVAKLVFTMQPPATAVENVTSFDVQVQLQDQYGNIVTSGSHSVSLSGDDQLRTDSSIGPPVTQTTKNGSVTFRGISFVTTGSLSLYAIDVADDLVNRSRLVTVTAQ